MAELTSHESAAHEAHALPVMLPPGKLIGRDVTLARVYAQLKENKPVLVYGASGIGKTALAATLASAYTELPGGVLWFNVDNTPFPELLTRVGRAYQIKEVAASDNPLNAVVPAVNALINGRPLVVFDGQINTQSATELIMRCSGRIPFLLVSDSEINGPWTNVALGKLEAPAAATLFKTLVPNQTDGLDDLLAALDYTPFAITVAAGALRTKPQTPAALLAALPKRPEITPPLKALTASFGTLTSTLQGLLLLLGATFRGEASAELFSLIAGAPEETINQILAALVNQQLVERFQRYGSPYYRLHPLTYTFAQTWLRGSGRLDGLQTKVRDAVLAYARKFSGSPDRLAAEMENFLAAAQWAADQGDRDVANQLAVVLMQAGDFVAARGYVYELLLLRRMAASSTSAFPAYPAETAAPTQATLLPVEEEEDEEEELDEDSEAILHADDLIDEDSEEVAAPIPAPAPISASMPPVPIPASLTYIRDDETDELDEARADIEDLEAEFDSDMYEEVSESEEVAAEPPPPADELARLRADLVKARQSGDRKRQAELLSAIGAEQVKRQQETEAISTYSEALNSYEAVNDSAGTLKVLEALAGLEARTDNSTAAVLHANRGVKLAEELDNETSQRHLLVILGDAHQALGESDDAVRVYSEALDLARTAADTQNETMILYKLGFAQLDSGEPEEAIQTWEDALTQFRQQGRRADEGRTLAGLGTASGELERWNEAIKFYTSALYIAREMKDREEEMLRLSDLGYASVQAHQLGQAVLRYRQALHLAYDSSNRENIVSTTVDLARMLVESQRHLDITEMLVDAALKFEPNDRDLKRLKERIQDERPTVPPEVKQAPVGGTAQAYAANAYSLLDNA